MARRNQFPARVWDKENGLLSCSKCSSLLPYEKFGRDISSASGRGYWCKTCAATNARRLHKEVRANSPQYKEKRRDELMRRNHGITLQQYLEKLAQQEYLCAICKVKLPTSGNFVHLDHDHKTGKLRDFLCTNCNRGLGHFKDSLEFLQTAINYLNTHNSSVDTIKEVHVNDNCSH
jgi:DNA-directed RNA polymerase subunit RPC12/RpoP